MSPVLPYNSIAIDCSYDHFGRAVKLGLTSSESNSPRLVAELQKLWTTGANPNQVLPCLSVRSGLDLFLQAQAYPPGSEVLMSAINIPDVARVVRHRGLKIVPVDIRIDTLAPKMNLMEQLISPKTVAILVAHLYGRWVDMAPVIALAKKYNVHVIEDCAECFCGFSRLGHPESDITLFSFGLIKFSTSFGGGIVKVRDKDVFEEMNRIHNLYPVQTNKLYVKKVLKYFILYTILYSWPLPHLGQKLTQYGRDPKDYFVKFARGFPGDLIPSIRHRPSPALLATMLHTHAHFDKKDFDLARVKGDYFLSGLTPHMYPVGTAVSVNNFWLFPVLVKDPQETVRQLNLMGLAAYTGSTQLSVIDADASDPIKLPDRIATPSFDETCDLQEAKYLMDHVIYLPINKRVPFSALDQMLTICSDLMRKQVWLRSEDVIVKHSSVVVPCKSKL